MQTSIQKLPPAASQKLHQLLDLGENSSRIASALGGKVSRFAVERYARRYRQNQQNRKEAKEAARQIISENKIDELLTAALAESLTRSKLSGRLRKMSPITLEKLERSRRELAVKEKQVKLAAEKVDLMKQKWDEQQEQLQKELEILEQKSRRGESVTENEIRRIRDIYGIRTQTIEYRGPQPAAPLDPHSKRLQE